MRKIYKILLLIVISFTARTIVSAQIVKDSVSPVSVKTDTVPPVLAKTDTIPHHVDTVPSVNSVVLPRLKTVSPANTE